MVFSISQLRQINHYDHFWIFDALQKRLRRFKSDWAEILTIVLRAVARGYIGICFPKIRPGKFLWSKNDVLMVIDLILHYYTSQKVFWLRPWLFLK